jgi:cytidylate kinase
MIVAIDGPASSGKSTTARLVASKLGFRYIDSGATYRAVAIAVMRQGIDPKDGTAVEKLSSGILIELNKERVLLDGEDVTDALRKEEVGRVASLCSAYPGVRKNMVRLQRRLSTKQDVICDGRDIGTVVFPEAEVKIYMDALISERTKRRRLEVESKKTGESVERIEKDMKSRDLQDTTREHSPLRIPEGAIVIDTTNLSIEDEVEAVVKIIEKKRCSERSS